MSLNSLGSAAGRFGAEAAALAGATGGGAASGGSGVEAAGFKSTPALGEVEGGGTTAGSSCLVQAVRQNAAKARAKQVFANLIWFAKIIF